MSETPENPQLPAASDATDSGAWITPWRLAGLIALLIFAAYPDVVLGGHSFFYRDFGLFTYPVASYHRACFWRGELPLWNPLSDCGIPFLAQWNTSVLYPFSLVYLIFPLPWSLNYLCLAHLILAGLGMYFLALRWTGNRLGAAVAGLAFAWNGLSIHSLMWISNLAALAWMPWVVLAVERAWQEGGRILVWAAVAGSVQMLTGSPEIILLTWLVLATLALMPGARGTVPRTLLARRLGLMAALVAGLAAVQLLPFLDLLAHSERSAALSNNAWAMPAWGWANFLVPLFHCSPSILGVYSQDEQQWTSSYYLGIGVLALAASAVANRRSKRVAWLGILAVAGMLLAMGTNEPVYAAIKAVFPFIGVMRYPIKFVTLTAFALPLLGAFGLAGLRPARPSDLGGAQRMFLFTCAAILLVLGGVLCLAFQHPHADESWTATWHSGASRAVLLVFLLAAIVRFHRTEHPRARGLVGWVILLVIGLDGLTQMPRQNPTVDARAYQPLGLSETLVARPGGSRAMVSPQAQAFLNQAATPDALNYFLGLRRSLYLNCNLPEGIPAVHGFFSLYLKTEATVGDLLYHATNAFPEPLADFVGASQISAPGAMFLWTNRPNFMPFVTAGQKPEFVAPEKTCALLASPQFDPRHTVYLPPEAKGIVTATNSSDARATMRQFSARSMQMDVESLQPTMVVLAQTFYHPWRAFVDGNSTRIWRANYAFQAFQVPAGHHEVRLEYRDRWFQLGSVITAFSVLTCLGLWLWWGAVPSAKGEPHTTL